MGSKSLGIFYFWYNIRHRKVARKAQRTFFKNCWQVSCCLMPLRYLVYFLQQGHSPSWPPAQTGKLHEHQPLSSRTAHSGCSGCPSDVLSYSAQDQTWPPANTPPYSPAVWSSSPVLTCWKVAGWLHFRKPLHLGARCFSWLESGYASLPETTECSWVISVSCGRGLMPPCPVLEFIWFGGECQASPLWSHPFFLCN